MRSAPSKQIAQLHCFGGVNVKVEMPGIVMRPRVSPFFVAVIVRYVMVIYQVAAVCVITFLTLEEGKK